MTDTITSLPTLTRTQFAKQQTGPFTAIPKQFYIGLLTGSNATLYTAPSAPTVANQVGLNPKSVVTDIWIANNHSAALAVTIYSVESGGSAAANRVIVPAASIEANTAYQITGKWVLEAGGTIQGFAGTTNLVTVAISGYELV